MKSVVFGPGDTWVTFDDNESISWCGGLPTKLHNLLNGRYNANQNNPSVRVLAFTDDSYFIQFTDDSWKSYGNDELKEHIYEMDVKIKCMEFCSFGGNGSYIFGGEGRVCWEGVPHRMEQLIQTRNQYKVEWAAIGYNDAWYLKFSDSTSFWGGNINDHLDVTLRDDRNIDKLFLSPFNENYYISFTDGESEWIGPISLDNKINRSRTLNPRHILYSNNSCSDKFSCDRSIDDVANGLRDGSIDCDDIPAIRVVRWNKNWYSLDNRRLWVFSEAGIQDIPVIVSKADAGFIDKLRNGDGTSILVRRGD